MSGDTERFCSEEVHKCTDMRSQHIQHRKSTMKRVHRVTLDLVQHTQYCHWSTMCRVTLKHTVKKLAPLTMQSSYLRCISAAEHQTAEQYSKTGKTKLLKHLPRSSLSWNTWKDFLQIPSCWEAALETERRYFSKVILESNVTPKIRRSSNSFSTVPCQIFLVTVPSFFFFFTK